jgi:hypothetical protein
MICSTFISEQWEEEHQVEVLESSCNRSIGREGGDADG